MDTVKGVLRHLLFPPLLLVLTLAVVSAAALVHIFSNGLDEEPYAPALYALSAYALIIVCARVPAFVRLVKGGIRVLPFGNQLLDDDSFRQLALVHLTLGINLAYAAFNLVSGLVFHTSWMNAAALYYVILSVVHYQLARDLRRNNLNSYQALKRYRSCGWLLCLLTGAVLFMVFDLVRKGHGVVYPGTMVYAVAFYAFFALISAIVNVIRFHRRHDPLMAAAKSIGLSTALVAMFSLQATMLTTFDDISAQLQSQASLMSGSIVCLLILLIGGMMIRRSSRAIRQYESTSHKEDL